MAKSLGVECKLWVKIVTTWTEAALARDVDLGMSADEIDASARSGAGKKGSAAGLLKISPSFDMIYDQANGVWAALRAAFLARTAVECKILDGGTDDTDANGVHAYFKVVEFSRGEPLNGLVTTSVKLVLNALPTAPATLWQTAAAE